VTTARLPSIVHVPMAQGTQGSTLLKVAERLSEAHARSGGSSAIVLGPGLQTERTPVIRVSYDAVRFPVDRLRQDVVWGWLGRQRPHYGRVYDPVIAALEGDRPDGVMLYEGHYAAASLPRWEALRRKGVHVCLYVHNALSRSYQRPELRRLLRHADQVVFVSEHQREDAEQRLGRRHGVVTEVVHNGVDDLFRAAGPRRPPRGEFVVTFVGLVTPAKGPHLVIQAADLVKRTTGLPVRVQIVGDSWYGRGGQSPYESWLRDQCSTIDTPVAFIPFVDRVAVANILATSSAACFPSSTETLPTAVLEAMASALPVVCSDIPGMLEAGGRAVIACPTEDIEALAAALATLAEDPQLWADRSRAVWERSALFSWDEAARALARFPS